MTLTKVFLWISIVKKGCMICGCSYKRGIVANDEITGQFNLFYKKVHFAQMFRKSKILI